MVDIERSADDLNRERRERISELISEDISEGDKLEVTSSSINYSIVGLVDEIFVESEEEGRVVIVRFRDSDAEITADYRKYPEDPEIPDIPRTDLYFAGRSRGCVTDIGIYEKD